MKIYNYRNFIYNINENVKYDKKTRSTELSKDDFIKLLKENCKNFNYKTTMLFRGSNSKYGYSFLDPTKYKRNSIEDVNLHTYMIDNLPSWDEYPKRSESIIVSNSEGASYGYGSDSDLYIVIPFDNVNIGVCPEVNIWYSMTNNDIINGFNSKYSNLAFYKDIDSHNFIKVVSYFLKEIEVYFDETGTPDYYINDLKDLIINDIPNSYIQDYFRKVKKYLYSEYIDEVSKIGGYNQFRLFKLFQFIDNDIKSLKDLTNERLWYVISELFNNKHYKFEAVKYDKNFRYNDKTRAFWIGGKSLLIKKSLFDDIKSEINYNLL